MTVVKFQQGEGPVNSMGALFYDNKTGTGNRLKLDLLKLEVIKCNESDGSHTFHNWNGDLAPTVHQYDRFVTGLSSSVMNQVMQKCTVHCSLLERSIYKSRNIISRV